MSAYDDMCVLADSSVVARICSRNVTTSTHRNKSFLWKTIDWARLCLLLLLVVSPVSAVPVRNRRTTHILETAAAAVSAAAAAAETAERTLEWEISRELQEAVERPRRVPHHHRSSSSSSSSSSSGSSRYAMEDNTDDVGNSRSRRGTAHWSQPCTNLMHDASNTQQSLSTYILQPVSTANSFMEGFREEYAQGLRGEDWNTMLTTYTTTHDLGFLHTKNEPLPDDFDSQLQNAYELMQRLAVGIEQVTLDQALYRGTFLQQFRSIEIHIVQILCQLHYAMMHRQLTPSVSITKDIMDVQYRDVDSEAARDMRDNIIIRNYNDALQKLRHVFEEFEKP